MQRRYEAGEWLRRRQGRRISEMLSVSWGKGGGKVVLAVNNSASTVEFMNIA